MTTAKDVSRPSGGLGQSRYVERLMGRDPAPRFEFIQSRASAVEDDAIDA